MTLENVLSKLIFSDSYSGSLTSYPFPGDGKDLIREYVTYLYNESSIARGILNELDKPLNVYSGDLLAVVRRGVAQEPNLFIDKKLFDGTFGKAYISETGTVVQYDNRLALMHEFIHVIRDLDDDVNYDSQEGSAGDTQNLANTIHEELGFPKRISYEATFTPNNTELTPTKVSFKIGTEYTEGNKIDIARVTSFNFDETSENNPPTKDLIILTSQNGKTISTGGGNDYIYGNRGDDTLNGGGGDDYLDGKEVFDGRTDADIAVYRGSSSEYNIEFLDNGEVTITDTVAGRDGSDRLVNMEFAQFTDERVPLDPGQDVAFVIDTTGSMGDDIAAVKARSNEIIDAIFDNALNSRIAVVGYNDPGTSTFLSFTNQSDIDDRKSAARNAINRVSAYGGGDFPEAVNAGLIRALNGGAGEWRAEASVRRIILFGDAPPNDTALRSQVLSLSSDLGISAPSSSGSTFASASTEGSSSSTEGSFAGISFLSIEGDIETSNLNDGLAMTTFALETTDAEGSTTKVPVEIFTVLIGYDSTTRADFESLALATGGKAFAAANASEVVDALIEAIETPTVVNNIPLAVEDTFVTDEDISLSLDVLINDSDLDGDVLTISEINGVTTEVGTELTLDSGASLTLNSDGTLSYDPSTAFAYLNGGETSTDSFSYTIDDGKEGTATATVTIDINGIDDAVDLQGTKKNDYLIGGNNHDRLNGDKGKDILEGGARDDTLIGGYGKDTLYGNEGNDYLDGGKDKDYLSGGLGDDTLIGGHGKDTLYGGEGNDVLNGGKDKDVFVLMSEAMTDTIEDFENKKDSLGLSDGLTFEQLTIGQADNNTVISITDSGEVLAILTNVESDLIDSKDFTYKF